MLPVEHPQAVGQRDLHVEERAPRGVVEMAGEALGRQLLQHGADQGVHGFGRAAAEGLAEGDFPTAQVAEARDRSGDGGGGDLAFVGAVGDDRDVAADGEVFGLCGLDDGGRAGEAFVTSS
jgi:hypothetical protein